MSVQTAGTKKKTQAELARLRRALEKVEGLTDHEKEIFGFIYGLEDGEFHTLRETAKRFNQLREDVRRMQIKVMEALKYPARKERLRKFREEFLMEEVTGSRVGVKERRAKRTKVQLGSLKPGSWFRIPEVAGASFVKVDGVLGQHGCALMAVNLETGRAEFPKPDSAKLEVIPIPKPPCHCVGQSPQAV